MDETIKAGIGSLTAYPVKGSVELDDHIRGFFFIGTSDKNVMSSLSEYDDHFTIVHRLRLYLDDKNFDSEDIKHFMAVDVPKPKYTMKNVIDFMEDFFTNLREVSKQHGEKPEEYVLLRGEAKLDDFMDEFAKLPFVHMRKATEEEAERMGLDLVGD